MLIKRFVLAILAIWTLLPGSVTHAQSGQSNTVNANNATGVMPYAAYGGARENISLATGNLNLQIPLLSLPGRGGHGLNVGLTYDSKNWAISYFFNEYTGEVSYSWYRQDRPGAVGSIGWRVNAPYISSTYHCESSGANVYDWDADFVVTLPDGSRHKFDNADNTRWLPNGCGFAPSYSQPAMDRVISDSMDASFMRLDTSPADYALLRLKDGTRIYFYGAGFQNYPVTSAKIVDPNGNFLQYNFSFGYPGNVTSITDSLGRTVNFSYASGRLSQVTYKDSSGTTRSFNLAYQAISGTATFAQPAGSSTAGTGLSSIGLPNGRSYSFTYNAYGELTKITYPTGGYTRYDHTAFLAWHELYDSWWLYQWSTTGDFRELTARRVCPKETGVCSAPEEQVTTYTPTIQGTDLNNSATDVLDPFANKTNHTFSQGGPTGYELTRRVYHAATTLLRTIQTDYLMGLLDPPLPIRVTTTLDDGKVSKVEWDYDVYTLRPSGSQAKIDNVIEQREYDYGLLLRRKGKFTYLKVNAVNGQDYQSTAIFILNRKTKEEIYDSSTGTDVLKAQTLFEYDSYTEGLTASGAVQHDGAYGTTYTVRGNLTATSRWRNTDGALLSTRNQFDDAGNVLKTTDPLTHPTLFSYVDSWGNASCPPLGGNAAAYVTSVADALGHVTRSTYNSCSGTVASTKDANNQTTTLAYDGLNRLIQTNFPDGGLTTRAFNEVAAPFSVTTTTKMDATKNLVSTAVVDGLGRVVQTQLNSDPQGVVYTDTTYDALGRKATVSNPYRSTSDPTFGITTFEYDALSRATKIIPPDGTTSSNNITTAYSGNTVTVTDQAGKQRQPFADALGRLVEVREPAGGSGATAGSGSATVIGSLQSTSGTPATAGSGSATVNGSLQVIPGTNATPGTGSATVNGNLQSIPGSPATAGIGSVTISGNLQSSTYDPCAEQFLPPCPETTYDSGVVAVTVNGFQAAVGYGLGSTSASVAGGLANVFNTNPSSPVTASVSGSTISLTAKATGASSNYSLSAASWPDNSALFTQPSFTASVSGSNLTGGANATPITYDSGSVWVTVNGVSKSVGYGQGSTNTSVATVLRDAINADGGYPVSASLSGTTLSLTARTTGASTNYSLSGGSSTSQPGSFSQPSFTVSVSGANLAGGTNGNAPTYDSGSVWATVNGVSKSVGYGQGSTNTSVATALRDAINADGGYPVSASLSGATLTLTARTTGASTNYLLSGGSSTSQPGSFLQPSFTMSVSGQNLTGGGNGVPAVTDSGAVWVAVNGFQALVTYGSGSTNSSVASALANVFNTNGSSPVNASLAGSVISLTAKTTGAGTNYSLSGGSTTNFSGTFSQPSFTVAISGASLTGGADFTPGTLATPAVTLYAYDTLDNLTNVVQSGSRPRTFAYNSLSQLLSASNPESGTISYTYDLDGNLLTKTDDRSIIATHSYDALHRLTSKTYSDGTPTQTMVYDINTDGTWQTNIVGRLSRSCWEGSYANCDYFGYDPMGRVTRHEQGGGL